MTKLKDRPVFGRKMVSMELDQRTLVFCASNFKSTSGGARWLAEWAANALSRALPVALSRLDQPERLALIDMYSGHVANPQMSGAAHLALMVQVSAPGAEVLADKCATMSGVEASAVAVWACAYWTAGHHEKMSPEKYAEKWR